MFLLPVIISFHPFYAIIIEERERKNGETKENIFSSKRTVGNQNMQDIVTQNAVMDPAADTAEHLFLHLARWLFLLETLSGFHRFIVLALRKAVRSRSEKTLF
ncbi:hypothetical protein AVEN_110487-1 [Araneus ventricosus]|uniref:Uncharacterized protein n=1 Tax=Araneus ventricosus TaxID=182803 RepID=A0A4Y2PWS3_ARAVE|nr:hypothetical protein AVEN_110487-1 [Araneus ventricosus]